MAIVTDVRSARQRFLAVCVVRSPPGGQGGELGVDRRPARGVGEIGAAARIDDRPRRADHEPPTIGPGAGRDRGPWVTTLEAHAGHQDRELGRRRPDPTELVERSMAFLLEREPPTSILRTFDLTVIGRFFPEYEATIRGERHAP